MGEYTQVTLAEWLEWKEDIRRKLQETAQNFVYIGYRLRQIRDSGMLDGCEDIFAFAQKEYGLGKSTVSRFIAINERFSEGGCSLELRREYQAIGSSKLSEMLALTDSECQLITERTTVKEIRELKRFSRQETEEPEAGPDREEAGTEEAEAGKQEPEGEERGYTPLGKCMIDFFSDPRWQQELPRILELLWEGTVEAVKEAAGIVNPGEYATHKKGLVFLFLYDWKTGVKYKLLTKADPICLSWPEFLSVIKDLYGPVYEEYGPETWEHFYRKETGKAQENQEVSQAVATSQREPEVIPMGKTSLAEIIMGIPKPTEEEIEKAQREMQAEDASEEAQEEAGEQIPGQDNIMNHTEYLPEEMRREAEQPPEEAGPCEKPGEPLRGEVVWELDPIEEAEKLAGQIAETFGCCKDQGFSLERLREIREQIRRLFSLVTQVIAEIEGEADGA